MKSTVGYCGSCGGDVTVPSVWHGVIPPRPTCESCGRTALDPNKPTLPMRPIALPERVMSKIDQGGQAFPTHPILYSSADAYHAQGMSLRDYFASTAPVTLADAERVTGGRLRLNNDGDRAAVMAILALMRFEYADAMLNGESHNHEDNT